MHLDLRLPIGLMFSIFGVMLVAYGLLSDAAIYGRSRDQRNLWWGLVLLAFGLVMCIRPACAQRGVLGLGIAEVRGPPGAFAVRAMPDGSRPVHLPERARYRAPP
jgi:hypothetical protein